MGELKLRREVVRELAPDGVEAHGVRGGQGWSGNLLCAILPGGYQPNNPRGTRTTPGCSTWQRPLSFLPDPVLRLLGAKQVPQGKRDTPAP